MAPAPGIADSDPAAADRLAQLYAEMDDILAQIAASLVVVGSYYLAEFQKNRERAQIYAKISKRNSDANLGILPDD